MTSIELEEIKLEREALKKREGLLREREQEIFSHHRAASQIVADETLLHDDVSPVELNYVLGASKGFVDGFQKAIDTVVEALANEYRDIPITESELYMLVSLGEIRERAWLTDWKQKEIVEKSGWTFNWSARCPVWEKGEKVTEDE